MRAAAHVERLGRKEMQGDPMLKIFVVLLGTFIFQGSVHAIDKIRIGFAPGASSTPFPLAQKKGFLNEEGFDAEIIRMSSTVAAAGTG
jgi:ABC-type nitrate/sulfonate/bicarbonate transport system substrate-binding protein